MNNMPLHHEIKALKANLMRNSFTKFTNSKEFRLTKIEHDYDDYITKFKKQGSRLDPEQELNAIMNLLNHLLYRWMEPSPSSSEANSIGDYFNNFLLNIFKEYIAWVPELIQHEKLLMSIKELGPMTDFYFDKFKNLVDQKIQTEVNPETQMEEVIKPAESNNTNFEYAVITALEDEEMEKVLPLFQKVGEISDTKNYIEYGHLKTNPSKTIIYASQHNPGMVDAAILASEIVSRFNPKYLIMTGVLGGKPKDTEIGDVVIATKVFELDRGKLTDLGFKPETSVASTTSKEIKKIHRNKKEIESFISASDATRSKRITLHFGPIACVNQVIDLEDFFEEKISSIDRKAIALEMESFSVVRSCEILNDGRTTPLIIKAVMDNTQAKNDDAKSYAAWTSAKVFEYIINNDII